MRKDDLYRKKAWFEDFNEKINQQLDDFYSSVPENGLSDREQYLYDTAQNQFKMLYELIDHSKDFIEAELTLAEDSIWAEKNSDVQM
jgi:hypothetical protein